MMVKFFSNDHCPNCPPAKAVMAELEEDDITVEYIDTDSVDGMVECSLNMVMGTPTTIVLDEHGKELVSWRGEQPDKDEILKFKK